MSSLTIALPDELKAFIESEAAAAGYEDPADYVRAVLQSLWQHKSKQSLQAMLVERIEGPPGIEVTPQFWADLKEELNRRTTKPFVLRDASVKGNGLQPGIREGDWEQIRSLIYEGRGG